MSISGVWQAPGRGTPSGSSCGGVTCRLPWSRRPRLEQTCVDLLQTTLCSPACPEQLQLLCAAILRERSPCDSLRLSCDHVQNARQLSLVASVLLAQVTQLSPSTRLPALWALGPQRTRRPACGPQRGADLPRGRARSGFPLPLTVFMAASAVPGHPALGFIWNEQKHLPPHPPHPNLPPRF